MIVLDVCNRDVITLPPNGSLTDAAKLMRHHHVGDVVVVKEKGNKQVPAGIVTDRDVVIEVIATELDPDVITVGDIMPQNLVVVKDDADLMQVIKLMATKGVRRMPVMSKHGELVGIVTLDDLLSVTANIIGSFAKLVSKEQKNEYKNRH